MEEQGGNNQSLDSTATNNASNSSKNNVETSKIVAEKPNELSLPAATYKIQVRNNSDIKDVQLKQEKGK